MKILIFTRPWMTKFYKNITNNGILKEFEKFYLTEFYTESNKIDDSFYINLTKKSETNYALNIFTDCELFDIIKRDRLLNQLEFNISLQYINTITEQIVQAYDKIKPDIVFGHLADTFVYDIFYRIAKKRNINQFSMVWSGIINNTFIFYEHNHPIIRKKQNNDINIFETLKNKREDISNPIIGRFDLQKRLVGKVKFFATSLRVRNPFNIDCRNKNIYYEFRKTRTVATPYLNIRDLAKNYYKELIDIPRNSLKKIIYISLHYVPEATLNNFSVENSVVNHDMLIIDLVEKYCDEFIFVIKEHPAMYNQRNLVFYDKLKKNSDVVLLHPSIKYYDVLEKVDYVVSWAGTIGIEAPFFNVIPLNITKPYYHIDGYNNYFLDYQDVIENFSTKIESINFNVKDYARDLNTMFSKLLWKGYNQEKYNNTDNINNIANAIDSLLVENFKFNKSTLRFDNEE